MVWVGCQLVLGDIIFVAYRCSVNVSGGFVEGGCISDRGLMFMCEGIKEWAVGRLDLYSLLNWWSCLFLADVMVKLVVCGKILGVSLALGEQAGL